jgi:uncharacterized membrane protein YqiK
MGFLIDIIVILLILFAVILAISMVFYKKCPPGSIMIIYTGKTDVYGNNLKIIKSGGAFIWPFGVWHVIFDLSPFSIIFELEKLHDKDDMLIYFKSKIILAISSNENELQNTIERISGLGKEQIKEICIDLISSQLRTFFSGVSYEELKIREKATIHITESLTEPLDKIGIKIINLDLIELKKV